MLNINRKSSFITRALVSACLYIGCSVALNATSTTFLNVSDRPEGLRQIIDKKYQEIAAKEYPEGDIVWSMGGAAKYSFMSYDDDDVVRKIVNDHRDQTVFNFLDVGAGNHAWAKARIEFLNKEFENRNVHFNIFSLTGEKYTGKDTVVKHGVHVVQNDLGLCTLYELSAFPIEILTEKLAELGYLDMLADGAFD